VPDSLISKPGIPGADPLAPVSIRAMRPPYRVRAGLINPPGLRPKWSRIHLASAGLLLAARSGAATVRERPFHLPRSSYRSASRAGRKTRSPPHNTTCAGTYRWVRYQLPPVLSRSGS
jgi:hypothetical protein